MGPVLIRAFFAPQRTGPNGALFHINDVKTYNVVGILKERNGI